MPEQTRESSQPDPEQAEADISPERRAQAWDCNIRWLANFPDTLWELLRLTLADVVFRNLERNFHPRPLPTRVEGGDFLIDEADLGLLAKHTDGRYVVSAYEHKSDKTKLAELQVVSSAFRLARQLVEDGVTTEGEVPILNGVIVLNGKARRTRPKTLAELAKLTPEEKAETLTAEKVVHFYLGNLRRQDLTKNEAAGAPLLIVRGTQDGPPLSDKDLEYVAQGIKVYTKNQKEYASNALAEQGVFPERIRRAVDTVGDPRLTEEIMHMSYQTVQAKGLAKGEAKGLAKGLAKGEAKGLAKAFLMLARSKFRRVPRDRQAQVRAASIPQLDEWMHRILTATSLNAVFDGDAGNGHAVNGNPVKSPTGKRTVN